MATVLSALALPLALPLALDEVCPSYDVFCLLLDEPRPLYLNLSTDFGMNWAVEKNSAVMVLSALLSAYFPLAVVAVCPSWDASWSGLDMFRPLHRNLSMVYS